MSKQSRDPSVRLAPCCVQYGFATELALIVSGKIRKKLCWSQGGICVYRIESEEDRKNIRRGIARVAKMTAKEWDNS